MTDGKSMLRKVERRGRDDEMILLEVEAEAMARLLSGRGKKRRERKSEKEEQVVSWGSGTSGWSGQQARAAERSNVSGQFLASCAQLSTWSSAVGQDPKLEKQLKRRGKFCCGTLGMGRAISGAEHTTRQPVVDQPTRAGQGSLGAQLLHDMNPVAIAPGGHNLKLSPVSLACASGITLGGSSMRALRSDRWVTELCPGLVTPKIFSPG